MQARRISIDWMLAPRKARLLKQRFSDGEPLAYRTHTV